LIPVIECAILGRSGKKWHDVGVMWELILTLFIGTYYHNLDAKNRIKVPRKFLEKAHKPDKSTMFYITKGMEGCLFFFTEDRWIDLTQKLNDLSLGALQARDFQRLFFADTYEVNVDSSGRVLVPEGLKQTAGIAKEAVFLGAGNRVELWDAEKWNSRKAEITGGFEEIAADILQAPPGQ